MAGPVPAFFFGVRLRTGLAMSDTFEFTVTISAAEWSETQRRLRFVEAALIQTLRGQRLLKEWFGAAELAAYGLPGLPGTKQGLLRRAHAENWRNRAMYGSGGARYEFHFSSLPRRAFEELLERIVATAPDGGELRHVGQVPAIPDRPMAVALPSALNATPQWLLPLLRVVKGRDTEDVEEVRRQLAVRLPAGVPAPSADEIRDALRQFGYAS